MGRLCVCIVLMVLPLYASAECSIDPGRIDPSRIIWRVLSPEALSIRNSLFLKLCSSAGGSLVDATDPTLKARLTPPKDPRFPRGDNYPLVARRLGYQGNVQVAVLVEIDGSIRDITVLGSSGHDVLDAAAVRFFENTKFKTPAQLDGKSVRTLFYLQYSFRLKH